MATLNVRGLNKLTKREMIDNIMKRNFDICLLTETNVNSNCVEYWDSCTAFFSTSIDPKVKEREEKKREDKNYRSSYPENEQRLPNYRLAADFENAGVGIVVRNTCINALQEVEHINGRIMTATFTAHGGDVRLVCAYAPHSAYPTEDKEYFYDKLAEHVQQFKGRQFIGGDFNARIHHVRECEKDVCGPYILGRGLEYLNTMNERTKESRALFLGFCQMQSLRIMNSQFSKPPIKLITYIEKHTGVEFGPPYDAVRFAQIDYWLVADAYKHACTDVQSRQDIVFESDHLVLECKAEILTQANTKKKNSVPKFHKPNRQQWEKFNEHVAGLMGQNSCTLNCFQKAVLDSAKRHLETIPHEKRKPYISRSTWAKIEERNRCKHAGATTMEMRRMNREINQMAKKDKQNHLIEQFNDNPQDRNKKNLWKAVKGLRTKFTPQYVQMKNERGVHVPLNQRAETIAQYLENTHWNNDRNMGTPSDEYIVRQNNADESLFRIEELNWALKVSKNNKQPGPDNIQMELLKWLNDDNRRRLLSLINTWWVTKSADVELFQARVVPIFKKGETDNAANYRPISLLSSVYKIYMIMIRQRMQHAIEDKLSATQYGFRPKRSTSHAIYIIRRLQDYAEVKGTQLSLALLDWEKAFDKIQHDKLYQALYRMGFSEHYRKVIENCYRNPTFFVEDNFGSSTIKKQGSGIRQGCPLSPYLFVIVMSCIDFDIQNTVSRRVLNNRVPGLSYDSVFMLTTPSSSPPITGH
jgi:exonuclease III